jgi:hypothetical protein
MGVLMPLYAFSLFLPTILAGMGYAGTKAQLLSGKWTQGTLLELH